MCKYLVIQFMRKAFLILDHRVHRLATVTFWRSFIMMEKLSQNWWGWGVHTHPLSLYLPSRTKLWCMLQLRGQIHSPSFYSTHICTLCIRLCDRSLPNFPLFFTVCLQTLDTFLLTHIQYKHTQLSQHFNSVVCVVYISSYIEKNYEILRKKKKKLFKNLNIWLEIKFNSPVRILAARTGLDESYWVTGAAADQWGARGILTTENAFQ